MITKPEGKNTARSYRKRSSQAPFYEYKFYKSGGGKRREAQFLQFKIFIIFMEVK
jgi:hypothetical protein